MPSNQRHDILPIFFSHPQASANILRHGGANLWMPVKMHLTPLIFCKGIHLANIMEQHGPAQNQLRRHAVYRQDCVGV